MRGTEKFVAAPPPSCQPEATERAAGLPPALRPTGGASAQDTCSKLFELCALALACAPLPPSTAPARNANL
jgi:hypothetical protein